jgi:hypothetical protein
MSEGSSSNGIQLKLDNTVVGEPTFNMPEAKIALAKLVLGALFFLVLLTYVVSFIPDEYVTDRSSKFAENIYQGIVPIVSMVIGYYFAKD